MSNPERDRERTAHARTQRTLDQRMARMTKQIDAARATLLEAREALHNMRREWRDDDCCNGCPHDVECPCTLHRIRRTLTDLGGAR